MHGYLPEKREENETNFKWNTAKTFMRQVLLIFICITDFSAPLRSKGGLCYTPGVVVRVCVSVSVSMCGSVSVSVSVSILVGVCCQVNQCFNAFTTYTLFRSFRTTQRDRLLYSAFTDTNCAFTDLERTLIKWKYLLNGCICWHELFIN